MSQRRIVVTAVAIHIDGGIDRMAQGHLIGDALAGNIESRTVVRRGADGTDASLQLHAVIHGERLEGNQSLIVEHSEHTIEVVVHFLSEEVVSHKRTEGLYTLFLKLFNSRGNDVLLLAARLRIQPEYGQAGIGDAEVTLQTGVEDAPLVHNLLLSDSLRHILDGQMGGNEAYPHQVAHHHRQRLVVLGSIGTR